MENFQQINWWLEIARIAIPSLVALVVPLVTYLWLTQKMANYQNNLSKELEDYKKEISKELENHKFQLQSTFQTEFYEFQTRYSLLHQKRAETVETLYALLAAVENDLKRLALWGGIRRKRNKS